MRRTWQSITHPTTTTTIPTPISLVLRKPTAAGSQPLVESSELSAAPVDSHPLALQNKFPSSITTTTISPSFSLSTTGPRSPSLSLSISQSPILKTPCSYSLVLPHTHKKRTRNTDSFGVCVFVSVSLFRSPETSRTRTGCVRCFACLLYRTKIHNEKRSSRVSCSTEIWLQQKKSRWPLLQTKAATRIAQALGAREARNLRGQRAKA